MAVPPQIKAVPTKEKKNIVTYVGALIHAKGFHKLAKEWKGILKEVPDAQLYVIGNGKLYDPTVNFGKYGIAEEKYENEFIPYLTEKGEILPSVHFMGAMGIEKKEIIKQTKVGVTNPTGISETFCLSAVEFEGVGIPVVGYNGYGFLDTVISGKTGYLTKTGTELKRAVIRLLKDSEENRRFGLQAKEFYRECFTPDKIVSEWEKLICAVRKGKIIITLPERNNLFNDWKWLKLSNRLLQEYTHIQTKSIAYTVSYCKEKIKRLLRR